MAEVPMIGGGLDRLVSRPPTKQLNVCHPLPIVDDPNRENVANLIFESAEDRIVIPLEPNGMHATLNVIIDHIRRTGNSCRVFDLSERSAVH